MGDFHCCPEGYFYVNSSGEINTGSGVMSIINTSGSAPTYNEVLNKCGYIVNTVFVLEYIDPEECPCCPEGYAYNQLQGTCCLGSNPLLTCKQTDSRITIPCIPCDCQPVEPRVCEGCEVEVLPITFNININRKQCTDCELSDSLQELPSKYKNAGTFFAYPVVDPVINFTLR